LSLDFGITFSVIATAGTQEKAKIAKEIGADHCIVYTEQDFQEEVMRITEGKGVIAAYGKLFLFSRAPFDPTDPKADVLALMSAGGYMTVLLAGLMCWYVDADASMCMC
jgi:threonine dehydrogenase-like Zn-dependent dehydrogenase